MSTGTKVTVSVKNNDVEFALRKFKNMSFLPTMNLLTKSLRWCFATPAFWAIVVIELSAQISSGGKKPRKAWNLF